MLASLGCGNPIAVADLHPGERVLDLGSGGGIDVLLSAKRVGPTGRAFGVDMTDEMLALAQRNAAEAGATNVEFLKGHIEALPLPAESVDVVISNCVVNLAADKPAVFREIARVLRPGGRIGITDIVAEDRLTPDERAERGSYAGCIAGALSISEFRQGLEAVGLTDVSITPSHAVAEGMVSAIVKAQKPADARPFVDLSTPRDVPVAGDWMLRRLRLLLIGRSPQVTASSTRARDLVALILAAGCWGLGTVISKSALEDLSPIVLLAVQLTASVVVLATVMRVRGLPLRSDAPPLLGRLGVLNPGVAYALSLVGSDDDQCQCLGAPLGSRADRDPAARGRVPPRADHARRSSSLPRPRSPASRSSSTSRPPSRPRPSVSA